MANKHTPGPWIRSRTVVTNEIGCSVAHCPESAVFGRDASYSIRAKESEANARLIAAAPELLMALMEIVRNDPFNKSSASIIARAAITKATGE